MKVDIMWTAPESVIVNYASQVCFTCRRHVLLGVVYRVPDYWRVNRPCNLNRANCIIDSDYESAFNARCICCLHRVAWHPYTKSDSRYWKQYIGMRDTREKYAFLCELSSACFYCTGWEHWNVQKVIKACRPFLCNVWKDLILMFNTVTLWYPIASAS